MPAHPVAMNRVYSRQYNKGGAERKTTRVVCKKTRVLSSHSHTRAVLPNIRLELSPVTLTWIAGEKEFDCAVAPLLSVRGVKESGRGFGWGLSITL